jgi:hypothetical protein
MVAKHPKFGSFLPLLATILVVSSVACSGGGSSIAGSSQSSGGSSGSGTASTSSVARQRLVAGSALSAASAGIDGNQFGSGGGLTGSVTDTSGTTVATISLDSSGSGTIT